MPLGTEAGINADVINTEGISEGELDEEGDEAACPSPSSDITFLSCDQEVSFIVIFFLKLDIFSF